MCAQNHTSRVPRLTVILRTDLFINVAIRFGGINSLVEERVHGIQTKVADLMIDPPPNVNKVNCQQPDLSYVSISEDFVLSVCH